MSILKDFKDKYENNLIHAMFQKKVEYNGGDKYLDKQQKNTQSLLQTMKRNLSKHYEKLETLRDNRLKTIYADFTSGYMLEAENKIQKEINNCYEIIMKKNQQLEWLKNYTFRNKLLTKYRKYYKLKYKNVKQNSIKRLKGKNQEI